jgi:protein-S-isoprenylcysteine O-methyltransferase Ste14
MKSVYLPLAIAYLLCLVIRTGYEILKKNGRVNAKSTGTFVFMLAVMIVLWASWFTLCPADPCRVTLPRIVTWTGFGAFILGWVLGLGALFQLKGVENIDHLVTTGLFAKIRHPMYTGFLLWILGWAVFHGAAVSLIIGLAGIGNVMYWRHLEENHLEACYGDSYIQYRKLTWF